MKNVLVKAKYEVQSADFQQADIVFLTVSNLEKSGEKGKLFSNSGFQLKPEGFYIQKSSTGEIGVIGADDGGWVDVWRSGIG